MTRADGAEVLADLDPIYRGELRVMHGDGWEPKHYLDWLMAAPGGKWVVLQDDAPVIVGGLLQLARPGTAQTNLMMVRKQRIGREARVEAVRAMRKVIEGGLSAATGLHRIECWTSCGDRPEVVKFLEAVGLEHEHRFECWGAQREPVWLYSVTARD